MEFVSIEKYSFRAEQHQHPNRCFVTQWTQWSQYSRLLKESSRRDVFSKGDFLSLLVYIYIRTIDVCISVRIRTIRVGRVTRQGRGESEIST